MDVTPRRHLPFGENCRHSSVRGNQNSKRKQRGEAKSSESRNAKPETFMIEESVPKLIANPICKQKLTG